MGVVEVEREHVRKGVGSCSSFSRECCCTDLQEGATFQDGKQNVQRTSGDGPSTEKSVRSRLSGVEGNLSRSAGARGRVVCSQTSFLDHSRDSHLFFQAAELLAWAKVPPTIKDAIRLGLLAALRKTDRGVRGIVAGDIVRDWWRSRSHNSCRSECKPQQPRAGVSVAHALQGITEMSATATITSTDGISPYDLISRTGVLEGLRCG